MSEELNFVRDLAVILISAGIFTVISRALKQPLVLGYIIAGFLVGPHILFFPSITSVAEVHEWSEIGIVFMMFALGLDFSFRKLLKVGGSAMTVAGGKFVGVFVLGFLVGQALSWTVMESVFLAGLLSMSSTAVVIKAYDDMALKDRPYAPLVFGTLVVEDLIAIILMVLLSTMAVSNSFSGSQMIGGLGKLVFFLVLWFLVGIYVIPTLLRKVRQWLNDEILLIVSIGLCFGMVAIATSVGFSSALGAFVMGSILAETVEGEHIEKLVGGIKNLFSAIFFVSVGMMLDPSVIAQYWPVILLLSVVVILSHFLFAGAGVVLTGKGLDNAVHTGLSLSQLGEFGFIIAGVGVSLGVMRDFIYPVIIAVSVITTFTTPYMIKLADPLSGFLQKKLPGRWLNAMSPSQEARPSSSAERNEWKVLLTSYFTRVFLYGVILIAIFIASGSLLSPLAEKLLPSYSESLRSALVFVVTLVAMSPFIYGIVSNPESIRQSSAHLAKQNQNNIWPLLGLVFLRIFIAISVILALCASHFHLAWWTILLVIVGALVFFITARRFMRSQNVIEQRFLSNLNAREEDERRRRPISTSVSDQLKDYDVIIKTVFVPQDTLYAGKPLKDIPFRAQTGVSIVDIRRGTRNLVIPSGEERIFPGDILLAVGTQEQVSAFDSMVSDGVYENEAGAQVRFEVVPVVLSAESPLVGKTLRSVDMRSSGCMVISVLHDGSFIANPKADFLFKEGDTVWIAGEDSSCEWFQ